MPKITLDGTDLFCTEDAAKLAGRELPLPRMERKLLLFLLRQPDTALSRDRLLQEVWGYEAGGTTRTVDTHVKNLRAHLGGLGLHIVTVRGVGYRLDTQSGRPVARRGMRGRREPACSGAAS